MKLRTTALCLIISLIFVPIAQAAPSRYYRSRPNRYVTHRSSRYYRPSPYPSYYRHNFWRSGSYYSWSGSDWAVAGGVGLLLGVLVANSNSNSERTRLKEREDYEKQVQIIRIFCRNTVETETKHLLDLISKNGFVKTVDYLKQYWNDQGSISLLDDRSTIAILTVSGLKENVKLKYTFMKDFKEVTISALSSEFQIAEEKKAVYQEPTPISSLKKQTGFELSNNSRDSKGYLIVGAVENVSPAYMAGIQQGDSITKVDTYDAKNFSAENVSAYIENRAKTRSILKITYSRNDQLKTVALQL